TIGSVRLYKDFLKIYEKTDTSLNAPVLSLISELASTYPTHEKEFDLLITCLYAGMVAEENKDGTILRKRIKRLGVHQVLVEERPALYAANFSRGKQWQEIAVECEIRGF